MSGKGSRDSGMNTTTISFLAFHSFLNRSILAAASSLMGDPGLWVGPATTQQNRVWKSQAGRRESLKPPTTGESWRKEDSLERVKFCFGCALLRTRPWTVTGPVCVCVSLWGEWTCLFKSEFYFHRVASLSPSVRLTLFEASGEAAGTFMSPGRYAN